MKLRRAQPADVPRLADLDQLAGPFPWSVQRLEQSLLHGQATEALLLESPPQLLGFILYDCSLDEGTVLHLAVHPDNQGKGVGRQLLEAGLERMRTRGMRRCLLEVRRSNAVALSLYRNVGFVEDGVRKNYYPDGTGREDAVLMSLGLSPGG
ncbi:MAG: ribosomal protein S18-alanine N-acetyltransferase [Halioglobus sp.]